MAWPKKQITHGGAKRGAKLPEYGVWCRMRRRCSDQKSADYPRYGGRGITVCERWLKFANFYSDMGSRPSPSHSIERKNNNGNYEPENCAWATPSEQARNRRRPALKKACKRGHLFSDDNVYVTTQGKRTCRTCRRDNCREWFRAHSDRKAVAA